MQITLPEDRLFDEMEQLVLSTKHLHGLLDDFVLRQPSRRVLKVGGGSGDGICTRCIADVSTIRRRIEYECTLCSCVNTPAPSSQ